MKIKFSILICLLLSVSVFSQDYSTMSGAEICSHNKSKKFNSHTLNLKSVNTPTHSFDVLNYKLDIDLFQNFIYPYPKNFEAETTIQFRVKSVLSTIELDAVNTSLEINSVGISGFSFTHTNNILTIELDSEKQIGDIIEVSINYSHKNVSDNNFHVGGGFVFTDSEPEGARKWMPCWDKPADKATFEVIAKVPLNVKLASNGRLADSTVIVDSTYYHWISRDPISTYIMVLTGSNNYNLDIVYWDRPSDPNNPLPIRFYYNDGENPKAIENKVLKMADHFSEHFGEHPFEKDGFATLNDQFLWGGMENQSLTSLCTNCWGYQSLIVHEFAHQWFGDMISPGTWADLWLNEGFATWSEAFFVEFEEGYSAYKRNIQSEATKYLDGNPGWKIYNESWIHNTPNSNTLFNYSITYAKSACVVHLLRYVLQDEAFFKAIKDYATDTVNFKYKNTTTDDFTAKISESSGQDLSWFIDQWVKGPNHPKYDNKYSFNRVNDSEWQANFLASQYQTNAGFFKMPIELKIQFADQSDTLIRVMNDVNDQSFAFVFDKEPVFLIFDPNNEIVLKESSLTVGINDILDETKFSLEQNTPNPFTNSTQIKFHLPKSGKTRLIIYDINGRIIQTEINEILSEGDHEVTVDLSNNQSGIYFYSLEFNGHKTVKRMIAL